MHYELFMSSRLTREMVSALSEPRARAVVDKLESCLKPGDKIIDIGSGTCNVCALLLQKGFSVTPIDLKNQSFVRDVNPIIFNGAHIPFADDSFDVCLLTDVLHHVRDPCQLLIEAKRVAKKMIVMETIYRNRTQLYLTLAMDMLGNLEFFDHAKNHAPDSHWLTLFVSLGLECKYRRYDRFWYLFEEATYCLSK